MSLPSPLVTWYSRRPRVIYTRPIRRWQPKARRISVEGSSIEPRHARRYQQACVVSPCNCFRAGPRTTRWTAAVPNLPPSPKRASKGPQPRSMKGGPAAVQSSRSSANGLPACSSTVGVPGTAGPQRASCVGSLQPSKRQRVGPAHTNYRRAASRRTFVGQAANECHLADHALVVA